MGGASGLISPAVEHTALLSSAVARGLSTDNSSDMEGAAELTQNMAKEVNEKFRDQ